MSPYVEPRVDREALAFTDSEIFREHVIAVAHSGAGKSPALWAVLARVVTD